MSRDILNQYTIIDQALNRIKTVLGINDAFLGSTFASDSGRKVQINKASSGSQLTLLVDKIQHMYKMIGEDIVGLIKQYYRANQIFRIADPLNSFHYIEINKPIEMPTGEVAPDGTMVTEPVFDVELNPDDGKPMTDEDGNFIVVPINSPETSLEFADVDIRVMATINDNAAERDQLMLETVINGPAGQALLQMDPAKYMRLLAMQISEFGSKHSIEVAKMLMELALGIENGSVDPRLAMTGGDIQAILGGALGGSTGNISNTPNAQQQGPGSPQLGIPKAGKEGGN
jgi:hypothetical protein